MIKLSNLEKYFNKNKGNEIHVINDINLTLPDRGLVVLLGPSGSGKTTLLNVLGGLDKTHSGIIDFDGKEIKGYNTKAWDHIRNEHIGYVFQNYNLLYDQTVYDNIALSLRMVGITDKEEIDTRVDYLLENMGMINYRRRKAAALSGGQQQRVAIARALAKNPKLIIADEPTGNLDSKNTFDIMNILRAISQTKLVVLVTHEENIANLYADRIIRLRDGQIVEDNSNKSIGGVDVQLETDIYLKDLNQIADYKSDQASYEVYSDEETDTNFDVKLIVKNKTLYVQVASGQFSRINLLEKDSEISVFDAHFKGQEIEEFSETEFDLAKVIDDSKRTAGGSVIPLKEAVRLGFGQFREMRPMKIFRNILFLLNAVVIGIALALLFNAYTVDNLDFMKTPVNQINVLRAEQNFDDMLAFEDDESVGFMNLVQNITVNVKMPKVYQTRGRESQYTQHFLPIEYLDESTITLGRTAIAQNEVVLNEDTATKLINGDSTFESLGIQTLEDLMKLKMVYDIENADGTKTEIEMSIVGFTNVDDPVAYAKEETIWQIKTGIAVYEIYESEITIVKGELTDDYRLSYKLDNDSYTLPLSNMQTDVIINDDFGLGGTYTSANAEIPSLMVPLKSLKEAVFEEQFPQAGGLVYYQANDPEAAVSVFSALPKAEYTYGEERALFMQVKLINSIPYILFAGVFLGAAFIGTFFIMRSSLLSRIYEVSVYRALGAPKKDLRRLFLIETLILTVFTSLFGYMGITYILVQIEQATSGYFPLVKVTPLSFVGGLLIILVVNVFSGILPVSNLLRRTPAEIISKYDF